MFFTSMFLMFLSLFGGSDADGFTPRQPGVLTPPSQPIHRPGGFDPGRPTAHR